MGLKNIKLICIILLITIIIIPNQSQATGDIIKSGKNFITVGQNQNAVIDESAMESVSSTIYNILLAVAIIAAIIWGAFIGIQLMMQGAEGKAEMKEALIPYVIGCIVAFSTFGIWKVIVTALQNSGL